MHWTEGISIVDKDCRQQRKAFFPKETTDAFTRRIMLSTPKQQMSIILTKKVFQTDTKKEGSGPFIITASQDQRHHQWEPFDADI